MTLFLVFRKGNYIRNLVDDAITRWRITCIELNKLILIPHSEISEKNNNCIKIVPYNCGIHYSPRHIYNSRSSPLL